MKPIIFTLIALLCVLQYQLWCVPGGIIQAHHLHQSIKQQLAENQQAAARNAALSAESHDLQIGTDAIEEHARNDLGMVKQGETFYQVVKTPKTNHPAVYEIIHKK